MCPNACHTRRLLRWELVRVAQSARVWSGIPFADPLRVTTEDAHAPGWFRLRHRDRRLRVLQSSGALAQIVRSAEAQMATCPSSGPRSFHQVEQWLGRLQPPHVDSHLGERSWCRGRCSGRGRDLLGLTRSLWRSTSMKPHRPIVRRVLQRAVLEATLPQHGKQWYGLERRAQVQYLVAFEPGYCRHDLRERLAAVAQIFAHIRARPLASAKMPEARATYLIPHSVPSTEVSTAMPNDLLSSVTSDSADMPHSRAACATVVTRDMTFRMGELRSLARCGE